MLVEGSELFGKLTVEASQYVIDLSAFVENYAVESSLRDESETLSP